MWATCSNAECQNYEWPIDVGDMTTTDPDTGDVITITDVACGPCGQVITNIVETRPPDPSPDPLTTPGTPSGEI